MYKGGEGVKSIYVKATTKILINIIIIAGTVEHVALANFPRPILRLSFSVYILS